VVCPAPAVPALPTFCTPGGMLLAQATLLPWTGDASLVNFSPLFRALVGIFITDFKIGFMVSQFQVSILHHQRLKP
jgi:hypothetical protein